MFMRIGMFANAYLPVINGVVRSIMLYRQGLLDACHFVGVFVPDARNYEDEEPFIFRYPAIPLPTQLKYSFPVVTAPHITWMVPRLKLDIIHAHHPVIVGVEARRFSEELDIPLVFTFHTMYHEYTHYFLGMDNELVKQIVRKVVRDYANKADYIIAPSPAVVDLFPSYGITKPAEILPTPVDLEQFRPRDLPPLSDPNRVRLIYVGRLAKEKNVEFLLRAFQQAAAQEPRLELLVVGGGPSLDDLKKYAADLGIDHKVTFTGMVPFSQVVDELNQADLFVFASTTETQGLVVLEAMAAGLPLVLVESKALLYFIHPGEDCVVVREDEADMAAAILALIRDPDRLRAMGRAARKNAENYSIPALTSKLLDVYQRAIDIHFSAA
jgi:glycosyltransferase involved in cell wall biosynthesis